MQAHLETLLKLNFGIKTLNFTVEAHLQAPTGAASSKFWHGR
jgi:hypothetical protein